MSKYVFDSAAAKKISAFVILKDGEYIAKIIAVHGQGTCTVNVFDYSRAGQLLQVGKATGYGYNRLNTALKGLCIDGVTLREDSPDQLLAFGYDVIEVL